MTAAFCTPGLACDGTIAIAVFCGTGEDPIVPTPGACKGDGTVYSQVFPIQRGDRISYNIIRQVGDQESSRSLASGRPVAFRDTTTATSYRYPASDDQQGAVPMPERMPETGGGGTADR